MGDAYSAGGECCEVVVDGACCCSEWRGVVVDGASCCGVECCGRGCGQSNDGGKGLALTRPFVVFFLWFIT